MLHKSEDVKSLKNTVLHPEIRLNLSWFAVLPKRRCSRNLGLTSNSLSEHLIQLPQSISVSCLLHYLAAFGYRCSFLSNFRHSWLSSRQLLAGKLGERDPWAGKALVVYAVHGGKILTVSTSCERGAGSVLWGAGEEMEILNPAQNVK